MLLGNIMHQLFQESVGKKKFTKADLVKILHELIKRKFYVNQLYEMNCNDTDILNEALQYLDNIESWLRKHMPNQSARPKMPHASTDIISLDNFTITDVCDIEESIWLPKYGIKGKIDLTIKLNNNRIIPIELKSGRSTFSIEHEGQVMLYTLLNNHVRSTSTIQSNQNGLLLYLKDSKMKFIKPNKNNLNGLLQLRNDLVFYLTTSSDDESLLPPQINDHRTCSKCPLLTVCSLLNQNQASTTSMYQQSLDYLAVSHREFFFAWYKMLNLEFKIDMLNENISLFKTTLNDTNIETAGSTIAYLKSVAGSTENEKNSNDSFALHIFHRINDKP